ncbi:unnamed protein product [Mesocestoides corti]|uniref:Histone acetyltransferase n=1 Tax=Mesocestoides corti TaxID=53468 RepID=A0A158QV46_MESCO|nr:unnamed protein product [Mesocestoides corti]
MLTANGSVGPPPSSTTALLTVNGIIPNQQMSAQQTGRPTPILTPAFFPNTAFASFPVPFSGSTSVLPCIASPQTGTLFQGPGGQFPFNMTGSMLVAQPQPVLNGTPINFSSFNQPGSVSNASPPVTATVVLTAPITSDVCLTSNASLSVIQNGTTSITTSTTSLAPTFNAGAVESTPPIKCKPEVKPVVPTTSVISTNTNPEASLASLEKSDFHRGLILEAIDKLRDRKARPDLERISCLLRRQHNISPSETQLCLSRLAENGSVVCVDYKGNMSYRNPSKWRKTAASAVGITNRPHISRRILEAIRSLIPEGGDTTQGFSIFQIEQAIKQLTPATPPSGDADSEQGAASTPELTGPALRICLDREATYGKLAKLVDGRYVLDETGDRKRTSVAAFHLNRRPFAGKLPTHGTFGKPPIAPALDSINGKTHGVLSIAPGRPIARRLPFPGGKRGRPPSIKAKKILTSCSQQPILPAPPDNLMTALDKRLKLEAVPVTAPTATFVPLDGTVMVSATPMPTLSLAPPAPPPPAPGGSAPPPTAMLMYPGLYNPTVFTVTPEAMVTASFQPDANATAAALTTSTPDSCLVTPDQVSLTSSFAEPTVTEVETSKKVETEISGMTSVCCRCQQSATEEKFLVCSECGLQGVFLKHCFIYPQWNCSTRFSPQPINPPCGLRPQAISAQQYYQHNVPFPSGVALQAIRGPLVNNSVPPPPHGQAFCLRKIPSTKICTTELFGYFQPETSPAEEFLWKTNFFGHASVPQLTYTLVYLLGKILCIRSGVELREMSLWHPLKLFCCREAQQQERSGVMERELHYTPPSEPFGVPILFENGRRLLSLSDRAKNSSIMVVLGHYLIRTHEGLQRSLKTDCYFLSWGGSIPVTKFRTCPLTVTALSSIVRDIQVVLTNVHQYLRHGVVPLKLNLCNLFTHCQQSEITCTKQVSLKRKLDEGREDSDAPLDLSVRAKAHPRCLEFWPEVTERARQEVWQCADCKSCSVCKNKEVGGLILICDACDKGFHATCHNPAVPADTDQSLPWICSACQAEGYRVQTSNPSACSPRPSSGDAGTTAVVTTAVAELGPPAEGTTPACQNQPPVSDTAGSQTPGNCEVSEESVSTTPAVSAKEPEVGHPPEEASPARSHLEEEDYLPPNLGTPQHEFSAPELHLTATRPADVKLWTVDQVAEWLREQGAFDKEAEAFRQQDIDGACLMLLKRMSVLTDVGIKLGPAVKIFDRIKRLQSLQQQLESTEG